VLSEIKGGSTSVRYLPSIYEDRGGTVTNYHSGIKNAFLQTNSAGSQTASKRYDAFGNILASSGTWQGRFAYGGPYVYQTDGSLQLLGDRYYDPSLGRFLTRDVAKDGRNWYTYCENNPIARADPSGRWTIWGYEFTLESVSEGLQTGWGSVVDAFSFGAIGPGKLREAPGFDGASFFARTGRDLLLIAVFEGAVARLGASGLRTKIGIHEAHHTFRWVGKAKHIQITIWKEGVKGSGRNFRFPFNWWNK
jgi:RHS repeat-associated protein